eukprot:9033636-Alexandrium_andersonii.AAC.1
MPRARTAASRGGNYNFQEGRRGNMCLEATCVRGRQPPDASQEQARGRQPPEASQEQGRGAATTREEFKNPGATTTRARKQH